MFEIGFLLGLIVIVFIAPWKLNVGLSRILYDRVPISTHIIGFIPIVSTIRADIAYFGGPRFATVANIFMTGAVGFRFYAAYNITDKTVSLVSVIVAIVSFVLMWISNSVTVWLILRGSGYKKFLSLLIMSIIYPIGMYFIGTLLANVIAHDVSKEKSFL